VTDIYITTLINITIVMFNLGSCMLVNFMHLLMFYWIENTNGLSVMMGSLTHKQSLSLNYLNGMGSGTELFFVFLV